MKIVLLSPDEWCERTGIRILDPDGWKVQGAPSWDSPISREGFLYRAKSSTVSAWPNPLLDEVQKPFVDVKITKEAVETLVYKIDNEGLEYTITDYGELFDRVGLGHEQMVAADSLERLERAVDLIAAQYLDEDS